VVDALVENEIKRLRDLGWVDLQAGELGIREPEVQSGNKIHYPINGWDSEQEDKEHMGYWARHRADAIYNLLNENGVGLVWEIGAGNGNVAINLLNEGLSVIAIEPLRGGAEVLAKAGLRTYQATLDQLKLPDCSISALGMFDVLEHLEKPADTLLEIRRVLKSGGSFICTVPAHQWLFSDFDERIGHFRRYSVKELTGEIVSAGFRIVKIHYLFGLLVLPALVLRRVPYLLGRRRSAEQVSRSSNFARGLGIKLDHLIKIVLGFEKLIKPILGLSIVMIAIKDTGDE
jgi:SAM-dependent methyltransferase